MSDTKKKYEVQLYSEVWHTFDVEADNEKEAEEIARDKGLAYEDIEEIATNIESITEIK